MAMMASSNREGAMQQQPVQMQQQPMQMQGQPMQGQGQPQQVIVVQQQAPRVMRVARRPQVLNCPMCKKDVQTRVAFSVSGATWLVCCGLLFIGCVPCNFIPFCVNGCKKCSHFCSECNTFIAAKDAI